MCAIVFYTKILINKINGAFEQKSPQGFVFQ